MRSINRATVRRIESRLLDANVALAREVADRYDLVGVKHGYANLASTTDADVLRDADTLEYRAFELTSTDLVFLCWLAVSTDDDGFLVRKDSLVHLEKLKGMKLNSTEGMKAAQDFCSYLTSVDQFAIALSEHLGGRVIDGGIIRHAELKYRKLSWLERVDSEPGTRAAMESQRCDRCARRGDAEAQFELADMYYRGYGVEKSLERSFKWCIKAAKQGHVEAQYLTGARYQEGCGVAKNEQKALKWFLKAAAAGNADAQCIVGMKYAMSSSVLLREEAVEWLAKAARQGDRLAKEWLPRARDMLGEDE